MPVVVMHGGGSTSGGGHVSAKGTGPNSHLSVSLFTALINPLFGPIAVIFACWSRHSAEMDWEGARLKGRIALWLSIAGVVTTVVVALIVVLICFTKTKDT